MHINKRATNDDHAKNEIADKITKMSLTWHLA